MGKVAIAKLMRKTYGDNTELFRKFSILLLVFLGGKIPHDYLVVKKRGLLMALQVTFPKFCPNLLKNRNVSPILQRHHQNI